MHMTYSLIHASSQCTDTFGGTLHRVHRHDFSLEQQHLRRQCTREYYGNISTFLGFPSIIKTWCTTTRKTSGAFSQFHSKCISTPHKQPVVKQGSCRGGGAQGRAPKKRTRPRAGTPASNGEFRPVEHGVGHKAHTRSSAASPVVLVFPRDRPRQTGSEKAEADVHVLESGVDAGTAKGSHSIEDKYGAKGGEEPFGRET